jgi:hypothetical protein
MNGQEKIRRAYMIAILPRDDASYRLSRITFLFSTQAPPIAALLFGRSAIRRPLNARLETTDERLAPPPSD